MYQYQKRAAGLVCLAVIFFSALLNNQIVFAQLESLSTIESLEYKKTIYLKGDFKFDIGGIGIDRSSEGNFLITTRGVYLFDSFGSMIRKLSPDACAPSGKEWYPITANFVNKDEIFVVGSSRSFYFNSSGVCTREADDSYHPVRKFCVFPDSDEMFGMDTDLTIIKTDGEGKTITNSKRVPSKFPNIEEFKTGGGIVCDQEENRVKLVLSTIPTRTSGRI